MGNVVNKSVNIYIDQTAAVQALDKLQNKADGFNQKIKEAKDRQQQMLDTIKKSEAAAGNIDNLKKAYSDVSKEIETTTKKLAANGEETKRVQDRLQSLTNSYETSAAKQKELAIQISQAQTDGKGTVKLQQQLEAVGREIDRTTTKINEETIAFYELDQVSNKLKSDLTGLRTNQKAVNDEMKLAKGAASTIKSAEREYNNLNSTISTNNESLSKNKAAQREIQTQIDKGLRPSLNETKNLVEKLRKELSGMSEDAPGYAEKFKTFQGARTELDRLSTSMSGVEKAQRSWMQDAKTVAFGVLIGNTVQSAIGDIGSYLSGILSGNAKLSDSLSDIKKATGLTKSEVAQLNKELSSIDTRTSSSNLREIAVGLGQVGQEANKVNVESIDKIVVALGDEFGGGAKEITTQLSVLRNNLDDLKTGNYGDDILRIGNALNIAGATGLATAPVVTDIANRIAGIGRTFKLTSGQILGVAATFQELGIETERGSTAIQKLFQKIGAEPEKFAKITGQSAKEFKELVNRDMLGAFIAVSEGAKKAGSNNIVFSQILKELDADGSGAGEVLSKLGANADILGSRVKTMTTALKSGSSITEEFTEKNTNLAAELEKLSKDFDSIITSRSLADLFASGVRGARNFIAVLKAIPAFIGENKTALTLLVVGLATMNLSYVRSAYVVTADSVAKLYNAAVTRLTAIATNIAIASQSAYIVITNLLTGRITLAIAAQRLWNITMSIGAGPIGLLIALVGAAVVAYSLFTDKTKTLSVAQERANLAMEKSKKVNEAWSEIQKTANANITETVTKLQDYAKAAEDTSKSDTERKAAIQGIININPEYFKGLDLEAVKTGSLRTKVDEYTEALRAAAQQKAIFDKRVTLEQEKLDLQQKIEPGDNKTIKALNSETKTIKDGVEIPTIQDGVQIETIGSKLLKKQKTEVQKQIDIVDAQLNFLDKKTEQLKAKTKKIPGLEEKDEAKNPFGDDKTKEQKAADKAAKKAETDRDKLVKELKDFEFELAQIRKTADESEIDKITKKYNELIARAKSYGVSILEVEREKDMAIAFLEKKEWDKIRELARISQEKDIEDDFKRSISGAVDIAEGEKETAKRRYADGKITKVQYDEEIRQADIKMLEFQIVLAESFVGVSKEASGKLIELNKKKNAIILDNDIQTKEKKEAIEKAEALAGARVKVLKTAPGTDARRQAEKEELELQKKQAIRELELSTTNQEEIVNRKAQIEEEYRQKEGEVTVQYYLGQVNQVLSYISTSLDILSKFNDARNAKEKAALDKELKGNDARRNSIKRLQDSKVISANEAARRLASIDKEEEKKKEELEKRQQARSKRIAIAQAIINGAMAITSTLAAIPGPLDLLTLGTARYIQIALAVATTAAQVATINAQKFAGGGQVQHPGNGRINVRQNIPTQSNGDNVLATVRVGEVILNERQQAALGGASTFRKIGVPGFGGGGTVQPFWKNRPYQSMDYPRIRESIQIVKYAEGGRVAQQVAVPVAGAAPAPIIIENKDDEMKELMRALIFHVQNPPEPKISLDKFDKARAKKQRIKDDSELR